MTDKRYQVSRVTKGYDGYIAQLESTLAITIDHSMYRVLQGLKDMGTLGEALGGNRLRLESGTLGQVGSKYVLVWRPNDLQNVTQYNQFAPRDPFWQEKFKFKGLEFTHRVTIDSISAQEIVYSISNSASLQNKPLNELQREGKVTARISPITENITKLTLIGDVYVPLGLKVLPRFRAGCFSGKWIYGEYLDDQTYAEAFINYFDRMNSMQAAVHAEEVNLSLPMPVPLNVQTAEVVDLDLRRKSSDRLGLIQKWFELKQQGAISDAEYEEQKRRILASDSTEELTST